MADSKLERESELQYRLLTDHLFWIDLLPDSVSNGTCLVLESRLGMLSRSLAHRFKHVLSIHASIQSAAQADDRLPEDYRGRVVIEVADEAEPECILSRVSSLGAIVVHDLDGDPSRQWKKHGARWLAALVNGSQGLLADDGVLAIAANNALGYRRIFSLLPRRSALKPPRGLSLWKLKRRANRLGLHSRIYLSRSQFSTGVEPSMELAVASRGASLFPDPRRTDLKQRFLDSRPGRLAWPSFLALLSRSEVRSSASELPSLGSEMLTDAKEYGAACVDRIYAGNQRVAIAFLKGERHAETYRLVARIPHGRQGHALCQRNAETLRFLQTTDLAQYAPRLISEGAIRGKYATIETHCDGSTVSADRGISASTFQAACDMLLLVQGKTAIPQTVTEPLYQSVLGNSIEFTRIRCSPAVGARVARINERVRHALMGRALPVGLLHGDFKLGNILFSKEGKVTAIIDWDSAGRGFPILDLLHLLLFINHKGDLVRTYCEQILPWVLPTELHHPSMDVVDTSGLDQASFSAIRVASYFLFIRDRVGSLAAKHPQWERSMIRPVVDLMERWIP